MGRIVLIKEDSSIRDITLAAIHRSLMESARPQITLTFDHENSLKLDLSLSDGELPIAQTTLTNGDYTLVTTRRVVSSISGNIQQTDLTDIKQTHLGDFKGMRDKHCIAGSVTTKANLSMPVLIEAGPCSMIMVYAIQTALRLRVGETSHTHGA